MDHVAMQEFNEQLNDFHRDYFTNTIVFLSLTVHLWFIAAGFWYKVLPIALLVTLAGFQVLCLLSFWLRRPWLSAARYGFVISSGLWALALIWVIREPLALFIIVPVGQISGALLNPWLALGYVGLMIAAALQSAHWLFPDGVSTSQILLPPILTVVATSLSLIRADNLSMALAWAYHSTQNALRRLAEAREHRAELHRTTKALDAAYNHLERANHMLVLARAEAEEAKEARNHFALAVSHELRTPLNFILGFSELMVNSPATYAEPDQWPPGLYEDIQEIYRSSTHLLRLVNDVLDLGQIEALRMALIKEWVDPPQLVQEVEAMVQTAFARKRLWFRTETEPDLPSVFVDRTRIRQILLNLVSNSLRCTERGGVTIHLRRDKEALLFCVQDTGPGIAKEDIPKVFEEFRQAGNVSWRRREGSGLGIPISRRFVELHGGQMWLESQVGGGTSFYFTLPFPHALVDRPALPSGEAADVRYWHSRKERAECERLILVLSPDPVAGEVIAQYTEDYGVIAVSSPDQVCAKMTELLPCAMILDQAILQDETVQSMLRELPYDLPVISFVFPGSPRHPRHLPSGVLRYLVKPVGRQALAEAVRALGPGIHSLLVVDDDLAMVRFVTLALKSEEDKASSQNGYRLTTASTGAEALERLREDRPDAILLDLALPDISGWDVLTTLQQDPGLNQVPVILITAHDWPQHTMTGDEQEALQVLMRRPLSHHELTSVLKYLLEAIHPLYPTVSVGPAHPTDLSA